MKPNNWVSSSQATELLSKQLVTWPLAEKNYKALEAVQVKSFDMGGFSIRAQFNPARIVSTGAKVDARSLKERNASYVPRTCRWNRSGCLSAFAIWYCATPTRSSPSISRSLPGNILRN